MKPSYEHTQTGTLILVMMIIPTLGVTAAILLATSREGLLPLLIFLVFIIPAMIIFSSLTVKVDDERVLLYFGSNALRRSFPIDQIREVQVVRNALWMGWGIHYFWSGVIYNVSGRDGIELRLVDGRRVRIGSDEPEALARAVTEAMQYKP